MKADRFDRQISTFPHPSAWPPTCERSFNINHSEHMTVSQDELNFLSLDSIVELLESTSGQTHFRSTSTSPPESLPTINKGNVTKAWTLSKERSIPRQMAQSPREDTTAPIKPALLTRWTQAEEIILQGVVIDCNLVFGTQSSWRQMQTTGLSTSPSSVDLGIGLPFKFGTW